ncbi:MAG TPA: DUF4397 domain-containing protein [Burkholderiaceae bacterium]|nr:DUF4397 domain-containing protein [Burkholderiaceae bacterium]
MKKLSWWSVVGLASVSAVLAGCGGSGDDSGGSASLRVANATLTHTSLDLLVNSAPGVSATALDTVSNSISPSSGTVTLQLNDAGSATALTTTVPTLTGSNHYTLLAYESGGAVKTVVLNEDYPLPTTGTAQIRVYDAALDAGPLDIYITAPTVDLATVSAPTATIATTTQNTSTAFYTFSPGTYRVRVTAAGNKADLRADVPAVTVTSQQIATVALTPASGGSLINGSTLIQQAGYTAARNTNARVRVASAVTTGSQVTVSSSDGTVIEPGTVSPAFGYYVLVPASSSLNVTAASASVGSPGALAAGADSTLLVYENAGLLTAKLLTDDNRLPADSTRTKLRLINGLTGSSGQLTLTANSAPVGINVAAGSASSYATIQGSTSAINLVLSSSTSGAYQPNTGGNVNVPLSANTVYSVLAGGSPSAPQLLIR